MNKSTYILFIVCVASSLCSCVPVLFSAAGTGIKVANEERSVGSAVDDVTIWTKIKSDLLQKNVDDMFATIDVKVTEGRVLLTGTVPSPEAKLEVTRIAWAQNGTKEVINDLQIAQRTGKLAVKEYSLDTWITAQIKSRLLIDEQIRSVNYSIETIDKEVYLIGIAQDQVELDRVVAVARSVRYVEKVVSYVRLKNSPLRQRS